MPPAVAAGITAGAAAAGAGVSIAGAVQGQPGGPSPLSLPPELMVDFINQSGDFLRDIEQDISRVTELENSFVEKMQIERARIEGTLPSQQATERLADLNRRIVEGFGGRTEDAIRQGFLSKEEAQTSGLIRKEYDVFGQKVAALEGKQDPRTEALIGDRRQALMDQLRRELGPGFETSEAGRRALDAFDREAEGLRADAFDRGVASLSDIAKTRTGLLGAESSLRLGAREQGLREALAGSAEVRGLLGDVREGSDRLVGLASAEAGAGREAIGLRSGLRGEGQGVFTTLGGFKFDDTIKNLLEGGAIGPGSVYRQSGVPRGRTGEFADETGFRERTNYDLRGGNSPQPPVDWASIPDFQTSRVRTRSAFAPRPRSSFARNI